MFIRKDAAVLAPVTGLTPEVDPSDLKAVRRFLTSFREEERRDRSVNPPGGPPLRLGIARARNRSAAKPEA